MGFQVQKSVVLVDFPPDSPYHGAEVRMALSIRNAMDLSRVMTADGQVSLDDLDTVIDLLSTLIVSWNLEDEDGNPIPVTVEAFRTHVDIPFMAAMFVGFSKGMQLMTVVDPPLQQASNDGRI